MSIMGKERGRQGGKALPPQFKWHERGIFKSIIGTSKTWTLGAESPSYNHSSSNKVSLMTKVSFYFEHGRIQAKAYLVFRIFLSCTKHIINVLICCHIDL